MIAPEYMIAGLVRRGLPEHTARAFTAEAESEAGLDPGVNEQNPVVPGSRGGFGLMQWTGPRRRQLEAFAAQRGLPPSDAELQMDFILHELQGSESRAWQAIQTAPDTVSAARAITDTYLRPGIPRYETRRRNAEKMAAFQPSQSAAPQQDANYARPQPAAQQETPQPSAPQPSARMPLPNPLVVYAQLAGLGSPLPRMQLPSTPQAGPMPQFIAPAAAIENQFAQLLGAAKGTIKNAR